MTIHILLGIAVGIPIGWGLFCIFAISHRADMQTVNFIDERGDLVIIKDVDPEQIVRIPQDLLNRGKEE